MSIAADPMSSNPISAQTDTSSTTPPKRLVKAKADANARAEPR